MACEKCGDAISKNLPFCSACGAKVQQLPMNYYKFMITIYLLLGAILDFLSGIWYLLLPVLQRIPEAIYEKNLFAQLLGTGLQGAPILYICFGISVIIQGIFLIIVRNKLARFKANAIKWYWIVRAACYLANFLFNSLLNGFSVALLIQFLPLVGILWAEIVYLKKRRYLFIH